MGRSARHPRHRRGLLPDRLGHRSHLNAHLAGARPSPNIWQHPQTYELENLAFDREGLVLDAIGSVLDWSGRDVLDIGCGTGFHLPMFARTARRVHGVEPHRDLAAIASRRTRRLDNVEVSVGLAQALPVAPASIDLMHARWAYFHAHGSAPGLAELDRVMRRGGAGFVIDNDPARSTFGGWFRRGFPDASVPTDFWISRGWQRERITTSWQFDERADFEAVVRIEFPKAVAEEILAEHEGRAVDYAVNLWWRRW